uniref:MFS domain-containing protein n=1 Tax=Caenorhabditis tropicalis TaxID=1561998 RepID=A0A1I7UNG5_9PELO
MLCVADKKEENKMTIVSDSFLLDEDLKQYTFQSVGFGLALGLVPLHFLNFLGTRNVTTLYGIVGIISAIFYPTSYKLGFYSSFITRLFQGAPLGILLWLIAKVATEWTPKKETAIAIAILTSVYQLAPFVAQISAAEMCQYFGWEYTYYFLAVLCAISHIAFFYVYTDRVENNKLASAEEKAFISEGKGKVSSEDSPDVPYSQLLLDPTVWTTWFANLAFFSSLLVFLQYGPLYMNQILGFSVRITGYSGGMAHVFCLLAKVVFGKVMDGSEMEMTKRLKTAWTVIEIPSLTLLLALVFVRDMYIQMVCIVTFITIHGVAIVIIVKTQTYRSVEHNHVLANGNTLCVVLCLFVQPLVVKFLVQSNTFDEWSHVFGLHAILILISVILFTCKVEATPAKWTGIRKVAAKIEEEL